MKLLIRTILKEYWTDKPDKWALLEMDLRESMDQLIAKHTPNWQDQYEVMSAIDQMFEEGFFQKISHTLWEQYENEDGDQPNEEEKPSTEGTVTADSYRKFRATGKFVGGKREPGGEWIIVTPSVSTSMFWSAVKQLVNDLDKNFFDEYTDMATNNYVLSERYRELQPTLKLFGLTETPSRRGETDGLINKIFHTAANNYNDIKNGNIDSFDNLIIPEMYSYIVEMKQNNTEYVEYTWEVPIEAYSADDAETVVGHDEDGQYSYYEYEGKSGFNKQYMDEEQQDREVHSIRKV